MLDLLHEFRFALRQLRKSPGFAMTVLLALGLGITSTTVIFSLVNAVLLNPLPLPEPDRLVSLTTLEHIDRDDSSHGIGLVRNDTSYPNFFDWRSQNKTFSSMASYSTGGLVLGADRNGPARRVTAAAVSADFFTTVGVAPELGRGFTRQEELPGAHVAVLSHATWQNEFNGDRAILGKTIVLSERVYTVVGVMPQGFNFPVANSDYAVWTTFSNDAEGPHPSTQQRGYNQLDIVGRLRPGVTLAQAQADMNSIQHGLSVRYADEDAQEPEVGLTPELQEITADVQTPLHLLFAAVCCLLMIVCANVAGLLLTRASKRRSELALRSALGATRLQILRQLLAESMLLSVGGGLAGLAATTILLKILPSVLPANLPRMHQIALNGQVMAFAIVVSLLTGLVFGVLPAWRASKQDPAKALGESGRSGLAGRHHYRLQSGLVIGQTAMSLVLLIGAGLLIQSFDRMLKVDPGFTPDQVATFRISIPAKRYDDAQQARFIAQLLPRLKAIPGVQMATAAFPLPLTQANINIGFTIAGKPTKPGSEPSARVSVIEPNYFETLRIPIKQGRFFVSTEQNEIGPPVVIVNEAFAKHFFPGTNPIGQHMRSGIGKGDPPPMREIVGVVGDVKRTNLTETDKPEYYIPYEQGAITVPAFALRVVGDPDTYARRVTAELAKIDSNVPVYRFQSYHDELARVTSQQRFQAFLLTAFAGIALLLAGLGLYAILSYMVVERTPELGLRIALGASRGDVLKLMLFRGLKLAGIGMGIGLAASASLTRLITSQLYGVKALDAGTFLITTIVLLLISIIACTLPSWRAATLDPNEVLRSQ
jgi:putative ABC transport system permease protein